MTKTTAQMRVRIAEDLRIKSVDVELSDDDAAKIDARLSSVLAMEREAGLVWWADNATPDACETGVSMMVCAVAAPAFGKTGYAEGYQAGRAMIAALKPSAVNETAAAEYF